MGNKKSAYAQFRDGQWVLAAISLITAINLILAAFSLQLFFPCSAYLPRYLLSLAQKQQLPSEAAFAAGILLVLAYAVCVILSLRNDRIRCMRIGGILYAADSLLYLVLALPGIVSGGFRPSHVIEFLFRAFLLYELYQADRIFPDPARKNPRAESTRPARKAPPPPDPEEPEDEEDEGIQW